MKTPGHCGLDRGGNETPKFRPPPPPVIASQSADWRGNPFSFTNAMSAT